MAEKKVRYIITATNGTAPNDAKQRQAAGLPVIADELDALDFDHGTLAVQIP